MKGKELSKTEQAFMALLKKNGVVYNHDTITIKTSAGKERHHQAHRLAPKLLSKGLIQPTTPHNKYYSWKLADNIIVVTTEK